MISAFGFSDPDKKNKLHDLACEYLRTVAADKLVRAFACFRIHRKTDVLGTLQTTGRSEVPLIKGDGQYKTLMGFVDVEIQWTRSLDGKYFDSGHISSEVKVAPVPVGQIVRQILFYKEFELDFGQWVLATTYPMAEADRLSLIESHCIHHVQLGSAFKDWIGNREALAKSNELFAPADRGL